MSAADEPNVYGEGNTNQPDFNALLDSWEAEIDEHSKAGEYGIAEGLRVASDELTALRAEANRNSRLYLNCHENRQKIEAERDALRERIRALADEWEPKFPIAGDLIGDELPAYQRLRDILGDA